jgi:CsoR family transcriptional regulator, copper-sensing transcriptional repressor
VSEAAQPGYAGSKPQLVSRLRKIEGQVRGIERMVADERYCIDVLTQIAAARTGLEKVALEILDGHVNHCIHDAIASGDSDAAADKSRELLEAVERFVKMR